MTIDSDGAPVSVTAITCLPAGDGTGRDMRRCGTGRLAAR
jgi:hypothetical protein